MGGPFVIWDPYLSTDPLPERVCTFGGVGERAAHVQKPAAEGVACLRGGNTVARVAFGPERRRLVAAVSLAVHLSAGKLRREIGTAGALEQVAICVAVARIARLV